MRILQVHNKYLTPGGEDFVVEQERKLLSHGNHYVAQLQVSNADVDFGRLAWSRVAAGVPWSRTGMRQLRAAIRKYKPDVIHAHNTFPLLSPSIYVEAQRQGVPIVQTLHNYRLFCANAMFLRDGRPCMRCVEGSRLNSLRFSCYRNSRPATLPLYVMQELHWRRGTFATDVDAFIALTPFMSDLLLNAGIPEEKIHVVGNFVPPLGIQGIPRKNQFLFIGRHSAEKGLSLLVDAWKGLSIPIRESWPLIIAGGKQQEVAEKVPADPDYLGWVTDEQRDNTLQSSRWVVMPSRWFEGLPIVLLQAYAAGTPVIVPRHGAFPGLVEEGRTGLLFDPNSRQGLRRTLEKAAAVDESVWTRMSAYAQEAYHEKYEPASHLRQLIKVYEAACNS